MAAELNGRGIGVMVYLDAQTLLAVERARGLIGKSSWIRAAIHEALIKEAGR